MDWVGVAFVIFQAMSSETLRLTDWVDVPSPFWHLRGPPVEAFDPLPAIAELTLVTVLALVGLWGQRRRDVSAAS